MKNENKKIRKIIHTDEFDAYYYSLDKRTAEKYDEVILYLETIYVLVKNLSKNWKKRRQESLKCEYR